MPAVIALGVRNSWELPVVLKVVFKQKSDESVLFVYLMGRAGDLPTPAVVATIAAARRLHAPTKKVVILVP